MSEKRRERLLQKAMDAGHVVTGRLVKVKRVTRSDPARRDDYVILRVATYEYEYKGYGACAAHRYAGAAGKERRHRDPQAGLAGGTDLVLREEPEKSDHLGKYRFHRNRCVGVLSKLVFVFNCIGDFVFFEQISKNSLTFMNGMC